MSLLRWQQRLDNYSKALSQLQDAVNLLKKRPLSELEKQGLIQAFEFTHELAWNVMKDYFVDQGNSAITGSRDAVRESFKQGLIVNGEVWMEMIVSRNQTSYTYNLKVANEIVLKISDEYIFLLDDFLNVMKERASLTDDQFK